MKLSQCLFLFIFNLNVFILIGISAFYKSACMYAQSLSCVRLFATPWTTAHQAPLSLGFPKQEYWSGLPFPSLGIIPTKGLNHRHPHPRPLLHWQVDSLPLSYLVNPLIQHNWSLYNKRKRNMHTDTQQRENVHCG